MSKRTLLVAVLVSALVAAGLDVSFLAQWSSFHEDAVHFRHGAGRGGFTTFDHTILLGFFAVALSLISTAGLVKLLARDETSGDPDPPASTENTDAWRCPTCQEYNPTSFETCWKCQRSRLPKGTV